MSGVDLFLFSTDTAAVAAAVAAGVSGVVVDWERVGKRHRQAGADTQIGEDTVEDLRRVRATTRARVLCRIDNTADLLAEQAEEAIANGADEIILPMVRSASEVEVVLELARSRCGVGILVETEAALSELDELAALPLTRVYVGLNDLAIQRGTPNLFEALIDGTVEEIREHFSVPFGFAGLTVVDGGTPIPCGLLLGELVRLDCGFTFLRRSYHADIRRRDPRHEIPRLLDAIGKARRRTLDEIATGREELVHAVEAWSGVLQSA